MKKIHASTLAFASCAVFAADLPLSVLDDCATLSTLVASVRSGSAPITCRPAAGSIERALREAAGPTSSQMCFLPEAPTAALSDFRCLRSKNRSDSAIVCYRPASLESIEEYRRNFNTRHAGRVANYFSRARSCWAPSGDVASARPTLFPPVLALAGRHELAFISSLDATSSGSAAAVHGFASASPDLKRVGIDAFEYLSVYQGVVSQPKIGELRGNLRVRLDDGSADVEKLEQEFHKAGARVMVRLFGANFHRDVEATGSRLSGSLTRRLADTIGKSLETEGFEQMDDDKISASLGLGKQSPMDAIRARMPFGNRASGLLGENPGVRMFMKTSGSLSCLRGDRGAFGAAIMHADGEKGAADDLGSIGVFIFSVGACAIKTDPQKRFLEMLVSDLREETLAQLPR